MECRARIQLEFQATFVQAKIGLLDANLAVCRLAQKRASKETVASQMVDQGLAGSRAEASVRYVWPTYGRTTMRGPTRIHQHHENATRDVR
ncbi:hypothetical protein DPMN_189838 [Dreissena polymorpha]|uniref:Uncharacterized protein n=1 Tax=Dreissena polymorpha TaxID=45954 RepID=A0A9D4DTI4_DREPO|nr:hypothetical protein DPMN_189838 [Dreissena polymorpha]